MPASYNEYIKRSRSKKKIHASTFNTAVDLGFIKKKKDSYTVECNKPKKTPNGKKKFAVLACDGEEMKIVRFGDPDMDHYREGRSKSRRKSRQSRKIHGDKERRKNFKNRHRCHEKTDIMKPGYWSCNWSW